MVEQAHLLQRPVITEKATGLGERHNQVVFRVALDANKHQIKDAIEELFTQPDGSKLTVVTVNTISIKPKTKRFRAFGRVSIGKSGGMKKALVTLADGQSIQIYEGV
ncbi:MAG: 50S ribosomal protein L23 [Proteobacteria bacterium]|nr:MAG: 50S ribosomal protein L23 [Pseudomonadota bacterium]